MRKLPSRCLPLCSAKRSPCLWVLSYSCSWRNTVARTLETSTVIAYFRTRKFPNLNAPCFLTVSHCNCLPLFYMRCDALAVDGQDTCLHESAVILILNCHNGDWKHQLTVSLFVHNGQVKRYAT